MYSIVWGLNGEGVFLLVCVFMHCEVADGDTGLTICDSKTVK